MTEVELKDKEFVKQAGFSAGRSAMGNTFPLKLLIEDLRNLATGII